MISLPNALFDIFHPDLEVMSTQHSPLTVSVTREIVESQHLVDCAVMSRDGLEMSFGDIDRAVIARSSLKPIQVLPLVSSGAADAFGFTDEDIALAAASHSGEPRHIERVRSMLDKIGLDETVLECGATRTIGEEAADVILSSGQQFQRIHNCCSGKHTGFLAIARHLNVDPAGYIQPEHPVQGLITRTVAMFTGVDLSTQVPGIDGCGIPTFGIPLSNLALSMVYLNTPSLVSGQDDATAAACRRVVDALSANPYWISGEGRDEVALSARATETHVAKIGAEGVFMASLPERGLGVALKARDGAKRAASRAIEVILEELGALSPAAIDPMVTNADGTVVGTMDVSWS